MHDRRWVWCFVALGLGLSVVAARSQTAGVQAAAPGTGTLSGTVIDAVSREPIAGATVSYSTDGNRTRTTVQSDDAGRFSFTGVSAGRLFISAQKTNYTGGYYGVRHGSGANQYFEFEPGEKVAGLVLRMWGNGAFKGRVVDEAGKPVANATVSAHRLVVTAGQLALLEREQKTVTNAQGEFQTAGLTPSRYLVSVSPAGGGQARIFYPSGRRASDGTILELGSSEIRANVDVTLVPVPTVPVEGTIGASDTLPGGLTVELVEEPSPYGIKNDLGSLSASVAADGTFVFPSVPSGRYVARALKFPTGAPAGGRVITQTPSSSGFGITSGAIGREPVAPLAPLPSAPTLYGETAVIVGDEAIRGIRLVLQPAGRIRGRVVFAGNAEPPAPDELLRTGLVVITAGGRVLPSFQVGRIEGNGSFVTMGLPPGMYSLLVMPPGLGQIAGALPDTWLTRWKTSRTTQDVQPLGAGLIQVGQLDTDVTITFSPDAWGHPGDGARRGRKTCARRIRVHRERRSPALDSGRAGPRSAARPSWRIRREPVAGRLSGDGQPDGA